MNKIIRAIASKTGSKGERYWRQIGGEGYTFTYKTALSPGDVVHSEHGDYS